MDSQDKEEARNVVLLMDGMLTLAGRGNLKVPAPAGHLLSAMSCCVDVRGTGLRLEPSCTTTSHLALHSGSMIASQPA